MSVIFLSSSLPVSQVSGHLILIIIFCLLLSWQTTSVNGNYVNTINFNHVQQSAIANHRSLAAIDTNHSLSIPCANQYCDLLETALSCKAIGVHFRKLCAQYFLGAFFSCPNFPSRSQFADAPYICVVEIQNFLGNNLNITTVKDIALFLSGNTSSEILSTMTISPSILVNYLTSSMSDNCQRRCFQRYISQGNALLQGSCRSEVLNPMMSSNYPFLQFFSNFQLFRNELCATNPSPYEGSLPNCYDNLLLVLNETSSLIAGNSSSFSIQSIISGDSAFDTSKFYSCSLTTPAVKNNVVYKAIANLFNREGCCFGNQLAIILQTQLINVSATSFHVLPPCLLRYLAYNAPAINPNKLCTLNSNGNITSLQFFVSITNTKATLTQPPVDIYNVYSVRMFQEYVIQAIVTNEELMSVIPNYIFTIDAPLQVSIVYYDYYKVALGGGETLESDGTGGLSLNQRDYTSSNKIVITAQFLLLAIDATVQSALESYLSSSTFATALKSLYEPVGTTNDLTIAVTKSAVLSNFLADPIIPLAKSHAALRYAFSFSIVFISIFGIVAVMLY